MGNKTQQARLVSTQSTIIVGQGVTELALFDVDGSPLVFKKAIAVTDITTVNATDLATAITLANDNKAKINALLAALRTAGIVTP